MKLRPLTPTAVAKASICLHYWHLQCHGDAKLKRKPDAGQQLVIDRGIEFEREQVKTLAKKARPPAWDGKDWTKGHAATLALMRRRVPWIYQGVLLSGEARGMPDLLKNTGGRGYIPVDLKNHSEVSKKDRFQLLADAWLMEGLPGGRPGQGGIWLNTGDITTVNLSKGRVEFDALLGRMRNVRDRKGVATEPLRCSECPACPWRDHCSDRWEKTDHVCLLPGATGKTAQSLAKGGFLSWRKVAAATAGEITRKTGLKEEVAELLRVHAVARTIKTPIVLKKPAFPKGIPVHFYDIETYEERTYLHGVVRVDGGTVEERQFFADSPKDEKRTWHEFLDYLAQDARALVFCWASYEFKHVARLWKDYRGDAKGYKHLRNMVDQCTWVQDHFALPVQSYSIKKVAPYFGFHWHAGDAGGLNSESWYGEWRRTKAPAIRKKILTYNADDVRAMVAIDRALRWAVDSRRPKDS